MQAEQTAALIAAILDRKTFAVVGASRDRNKFGYQVFRFLKSAGYTVFPVNPNARSLDGDRVYDSINDISESIDCVVTVVPPEITATAVGEAVRLGIPYIWMQPGSESETAVNLAEEAGAKVVQGGPCIMVMVAARQRKTV